VKATKATHVPSSTDTATRIVTPASSSDSSTKSPQSCYLVPARGGAWTALSDVPRAEILSTHFVQMHYGPMLAYLGYKEQAAAIHVDTRGKMCCSGLPIMLQAPYTAVAQLWPTGDPGIGKSQVMRFASLAAARAVTASGRGSSAAVSAGQPNAAAEEFLLPGRLVWFS
jgi:hypothetical protein